MRRGGKRSVVDLSYSPVGPLECSAPQEVLLQALRSGFEIIPEREIKRSLFVLTVLGRFEFECKENRLGRTLVILRDGTDIPLGSLRAGQSQLLETLDLRTFFFFSWDRALLWFLGSSFLGCVYLTNSI